MLSFLTIATKLAEILGAYFIKRNLDSLFSDKSDLNSRLARAINGTLDDYMKLYPIEDVDNKYGFYKSEILISELLKYRMMGEDYNASDLYHAFDSETNIITPKKEDIEKFYEIFLEKINSDDKLKRIEIKETFDIEIFNISRKLDELKRYIENVLAEINTQLESEWKRQIEVYKESFNKFKPKTALELLLKLEESFQTSLKKPPTSLSAAIEFLKSQCHDFLGNKNDVYKSSINAYNLEPTSKVYLELACYSYAKIKNYEKASILLTELLKKDELNSYGWIVKIIISVNSDLDSLINDVPDFVRNDKDFRRMLFYNVFINDKYSNQEDIFNKYSLIPPISEYDKTELTIKNFKEKLFWIESKLTEYIRTTNFDFLSVKRGENEIARFLYLISSQFINTISDSEIKDNYKALDFYNKYFEFVITGNKEAVHSMNSVFPSIKNKQEPLFLILANSLQIIGEVSIATGIIDSKENPSLELLYLKAFCCTRNRDVSNYVITGKKILSLTSTVDIYTLINILTIPTTLSSFDSVNEIDDIEYTSEKKFEFPFLRILLESYLKVLKNKTDLNTLAEIQSIEQNVLETSSNLCFYVSYSYFLLEQYDLAINFFRQYVSSDNESQDLFNYILSLKKAASSHKELLLLLAKWRKEFTFNEHLLRMEADLRRQLLDWDSCFEICEFFLSKIPVDEAFLTLNLISINELDEEKQDDKINELALFFETYEFSHYRHIQIVSNILFHRGFHKIALEILFAKAIDTGNKQARIDYFLLIIQTPTDLIQEKEFVEVGCYVKYSINKEVNFVKIDGSTVLSDALVGHKKGDTITVQRPLIATLDYILIIRVMDKFLYLHDQIMEEVMNNPYSGFPMQSIEIPDMTPEGLNKTLVSLMGASGTVLHDQQEAVWNNYYNYQISFSEIVVQIYSSDYIGGYFNLITFKEGVTQVPLLYYPQKTLRENNEFIIDFSSLFILFQISTEHKINFPHKFIIAKGTVDLVRYYLKKERLNKQKQLSINITLDGIRPSFLTETDSENNVKYLDRLINWIETNCKIMIIESKLDLINKGEELFQNDIFTNVLSDNISLIYENNERMLITDDSIYFKFFPINSGKTISSEFYIKAYYDNKIEILTEFVKYKYIGFAFSTEILINEFQKKTKDQLNSYSHCINNTSLRLIPSNSTILIIVKFLKDVALNSFINDEVFKQEATNAFINLLKGQKSIKPFQATKLIIIEEFNLMGAKFNLILESFENAKQILNIGDGNKNI